MNLSLGFGLDKYRVQDGTLLNSLESLKSSMAFWSDSFDFVNKQLLDKSGNENHVPLIGGNCVEFKADLTITLYPAQTGATVTEVNKAATTTGVTVVSGNIAIDFSELPNAKIYQIKLSTGDELLLTGGSNNYVYCKPTLWGRIGGTIVTDWDWSTQNDYFGNLQNGCSVGGLFLPNLIPSAMNDGTWTKRNFTTPDANTVVYTGALNTSQSWFYKNAALVVGLTYRLKITVWDSTEDFPANTVRFAYLTSSTIAVDDEGINLYMNGTHYITFVHSGATHRVAFEWADTNKDFTGKALKFKIDYVQEYSATAILPKSGATDAMGNVLTNPASITQHNGCEVKLNFSGITGVTDAAGDPLSLSAAYAFGTAVSNPIFKRVSFNSEIKEVETDYIVFQTFQNGNTLSSILTLLEESNMLVKLNSDGSLLVVNKWDASNDRVFLFDRKGHNEYYSLMHSQTIANAKQLPVPHEKTALTNAFAYDFSDNIGPYYIDGVGWSGGTHVQPDSDTPAADWQEILAVNNTIDTVDIGDATDFPDPISGKKRLAIIKVYSGSAYTTLLYSHYTKAGLVVSLESLTHSVGLNLSTVVVGGATPSQLVYNFKTINNSEKTIAGATSSWAAVKAIEIDVVNDIIDHTEIDKATLTGGLMVQENVKFIISQKAPTVFVDYNSEFKVAKTVGLYYGLQYEIRGFAGGKVYFAHGVDNTLQDAATQDSGDKATYLCEKYVMVTGVVNATMQGVAMFMDLNYGTPAANESTAPYFGTPAKAYFYNILHQDKAIGDIVTWRGGYNYFKNVATTQYILAYFQYENGSLYFIVDFTGSLTFAPSKTEVFAAIAGRKCEVVYKDAAITCNAVTGSSFTAPNTGLSLTATAAGNIKIKIT